MVSLTACYSHVQLDGLCQHILSNGNSGRRRSPVRCSGVPTLCGAPCRLCLQQVRLQLRHERSIEPVRGCTDCHLFVFGSSAALHIINLRCSWLCPCTGEGLWNAMNDQPVGTAAVIDLTDCPYTLILWLVLDTCHQVDTDTDMCFYEVTAPDRTRRF